MKTEAIVGPCCWLVHEGYFVYSLQAKEYKALFKKLGIPMESQDRGIPIEPQLLNLPTKSQDVGITIKQFAESSI